MAFPICPGIISRLPYQPKAIHLWLTSWFISCSMTSMQSMTSQFCIYNTYFDVIDNIIFDVTYNNHGLPLKKY